MIQITLDTNLHKDDGSIIFIPSFQIWWNWYKYKKIMAITVMFLIWDFTIKYQKL